MYQLSLLEACQKTLVLYKEETWFVRTIGETYFGKIIGETWFVKSIGETFKKIFKKF